ncbi:PREDICTED: uncharacterized protein LOC105556605 [Vollenhovia emeryi]|uniref:uncharacterized protein LOC105556605 n=1 Tax=Vollenhovia emeryi TaxID=411798 RepID=UPI0005F58A3C|nr:PREDICTED: uncharacterized protein LOC105556605 [Vollenhovia emeryi]
MNMEASELFENAVTVFNEDEYHSWERRCEECIESLREECQRCGNPTGTVNSLVALIARLEGARTELRGRLVHTGAGHNGFTRLEIETAFRRRVLTGAVINSRYIEPRRFLEDARDMVIEKVRENMDRHACVKINTVFNGEFVANKKTAVKSITTKNRQLCPTTDLFEWYNKTVIDTTLAALEEFQERYSGWALSRIMNLMINVNRCNPMRVGCWIDMPPVIKLKKAVVNVKSMDNACFAWAVVAALYPAEKHTSRCNQYPDYRTVLKLDGIDFPMTLKRISRFERLNDMSINVFTMKDEKRMERSFLCVSLIIKEIFI